MSPLGLQRRGPPHRRGGRSVLTGRLQRPPADGLSHKSAHRHRDSTPFITREVRNLVIVAPVGIPRNDYAVSVLDLQVELDPTLSAHTKGAHRAQRHGDDRRTLDELSIFVAVSADPVFVCRIVPIDEGPIDSLINVASPGEKRPEPQRHRLRLGRSPGEPIFAAISLLTPPDLLLTADADVLRLGRPLSPTRSEERRVRGSKERGVEPPHPDARGVQQGDVLQVGMRRSDRGGLKTPGPARSDVTVQSGAVGPSLHISRFDTSSVRNHRTQRPDKRTARRPCRPSRSRTERRLI